jgi:hypothetical protein
MTTQAPQARDGTDRVVPFRPRARIPGRLPHDDAIAKWTRGDTRPAVEDIVKFHQRAGDDDYRQRMIMNVLALAACIVLALIGIWLANAIAQMRKDQDCVLSGRPSCTRLDVPLRRP